MRWDIMRKEVLQNIQTLRFGLSLLLVILVFGTSSFVFVGKHKQKLEDYRNETNKNLSTLSKKAKNLSSLASYQQTVWRKPKVLATSASSAILN